MTRLLVLGYGLAAYGLFLLTFAYTIGFVGDLVVPKSIDTGGTVGSVAIAILVDIGLLVVFAVQHTIMARPAFKAWLARRLPAAIERSTFVLATCGVLALLFWLWRPIPELVWSAEGPLRIALVAAFCAGWGIVLLATLMIGHCDLFGLYQVWCRWRGSQPTPDAVRAPGLYRFIRHPIMLGFAIAFWAAPDMTIGRALFAGVTSAYILFGVRMEERDLLLKHSVDYAIYRRRVPMFLPRLGPRSAPPLDAGASHPAP